MPLSAIEHYAYCPRQAGLILLESAFTDNVDTTLGHLAHRVVHQSGVEQRSRVRVVRGMPVWSDRLGVHGVCDVVEITASGAVPVEHKVGRYEPGGPADLQAIGQALCLRERLGVVVEHAVVYSTAERHRHVVHVTDQAIERLVHVIDSVRMLLDEQQLPGVTDRRSRCRRCSLKPDCLPDVIRRGEPPSPFTPYDEAQWND